MTRTDLIAFVIRDIIPVIVVKIMVPDDCKLGRKRVKCVPKTRYAKLHQICEVANMLEATCE